MQFDGTWRNAVARAQSDTECPLRIGRRSVDYSDGGYGVTIIGSNVAVKDSEHTWRNRYVEVCGHGSGAVIIPFVGESILFERHYRIATDEYSWELPRGFGNPDETDAQTARRELRENTGLSADDVMVISRIHADAGIMNDDIAVVATRSGSVDYMTPDHSWEAMGFALVPVNELDDFIAAANVNDGITLAALRLLITMSSGKIRAISHESRHEDGPYSGTVYEKPTFDDLDRLNHQSDDLDDDDIKAPNYNAAEKADNDISLYRVNDYDFDDDLDDIRNKFDTASQNLDSLSDALGDNDSDDYTFDIDDGDDDTDFIIHANLDTDSVADKYKTLIDTDGDGRPDSLANFGYGDTDTDDNLTDDDFAFDGDDENGNDDVSVDDYSFDIDDKHDSNLNDEDDTDDDDLDGFDDAYDEDETYNALFGSSDSYKEFSDKRHAIVEYGDDDDKPQNHQQQIYQGENEQVDSAQQQQLDNNADKRTDDDTNDALGTNSETVVTDSDDFDDDDYLESDDDDAPADIKSDMPMLDTDESDKLKSLIAEFSAKHANDINQQHEADNEKGNVTSEVADTDDSKADDNVTPIDMSSDENNDTVNEHDDAAPALDDNDNDEAEDKNDVASNDEIDKTSDDDVNDDDDDEWNDDDVDDDNDWGKIDDDDDENEDDEANDTPQQPLPPMWATEVITTSNAKPQQIGDVMRYLTNGDRSKVGRLIVNFGRREFFIKPIDPDERVTRLDSHNVGRICDGGLVDFDNDEYEQQLKELISTMEDEKKVATADDETENDNNDNETAIADGTADDDKAVQHHDENNNETNEQEDNETIDSANDEQTDETDSDDTSDENNDESTDNKQSQQVDSNDDDTDDDIDDLGIDTDDVIDSMLEEIDDKSLDDLGDMSNLLDDDSSDEDSSDDNDDMSIDDMF